MNFWKAFADNPPILVRLLARQRTKGSAIAAISMEEIAIASGLPLVRVQEISGMLDWSAVTLFEAQRFCAGCLFDPTNPQDRNRKRSYTASCRKNPTRQWFSYLRRSPLFKSEFEPLILKLKQSQTKSTASSRTTTV